MDLTNHLANRSWGGVKRASSKAIRIFLPSIILIWAAVASAQCRFVNMQIHNGATGFRGINDGGSIVGVYISTDSNNQQHFNGFLMRNGNVQTVNFPNATQTLLNDIGDTGEIVGFYEITAGGEQGAFARVNGQFRKIVFPGSASGSTSANGVNSQGDIVGSYAVGTITHGFLLSSGHFSTIDFPGTQSTQLSKINDSGMITGQYLDANGNSQSFGYQNGSFKKLSDPSGTETFAYGVSDLGTVVGYTDTGFETPQHGFVWHAGVFKTLNDPKFPGRTILRGVNRSGVIVGEAAPFGFAAFGCAQ